MKEGWSLTLSDGFKWDISLQFWGIEGRRGGGLYKEIRLEAIREDFLGLGDQIPSKRKKSSNSGREVPLWGCFGISCGKIFGGRQKWVPSVPHSRCSSPSPASTTDDCWGRVGDGKGGRRDIDNDKVDTNIYRVARISIRYLIVATYIYFLCLIGYL